MINLDEWTQGMPQHIRERLAGMSRADLLTMTQSAIDQQRIAEHQALEVERARAAAAAAERRGLTYRLPERYAQVTFDQVPPRTHGTEPMTQAHAQIVRNAQRYVENFGQVPGLSMVFHGISGNGKTSLACAVANGVAARGYSIHYTTALEFFGRVKDSFGDRKAENEGAVFAALNAPALLILDEVGRGYLSDSEKTWLFRLIDQSYRSGKSMLMISNLADKQLASTLTDAGYDRMVERCQTPNRDLWHEFTWPSFRRRKSTEASP